jgi:hypothetical protein
VAPVIPIGKFRVANRTSLGKINIGEPGEIHSDLLAKGQYGEPGFADDTGRFYTRDEALAALDARDRAALDQTPSGRLVSPAEISLEGRTLREAQAARAVLGGARPPGVA